MLSIARCERSIGAADGFSLFEALIATSILAGAVAGLAHLTTVASRAHSGAGTTTFSVVLAQQKMEQLRGLAWSTDVQGLPLSDTTTDTTVTPEAANGGTGLSPSPPGSLDHDIPGFCDVLDRAGRGLGGGQTPAPGAVYLRRWSVEPLPRDPENTLVLQVVVAASRPGGGASGASPARWTGGARLVSIRTRKAS